MSKKITAFFIFKHCKRLQKNDLVYYEGEMKALLLHRILLGACIMSQSLLGIVVLLISLGIVYGGFRYVRSGKRAYASAGVKVDFNKTPAAYGFAPGVIGTIIMLVGVCGIVWSLILL